MESLVYVDRSAIRPGRLVELEQAARQLLKHVASNQEEAYSYGIYFSVDGTSMSVVHVHPNARSLEQLMGLIAPVLAPFRELLELRSIDVYGSPSDAVLGQLRAKADLLGGTITLHHRVAGTDDDALSRGTRSTR
jgi:hypothetical protein